MATLIISILLKRFPISRIFSSVIFCKIVSSISVIPWVASKMMLATPTIFSTSFLSLILTFLSPTLVFTLKIESNNLVSIKPYVFPRTVLL